MKHYWCEYWTRMEGTNHYICACGISTVKQKQKEMWAKGDSWTDDLRKVDCPKCLQIIKEKLFPNYATLEEKVRVLEQELDGVLKMIGEAPEAGEKEG